MNERIVIHPEIQHGKPVIRGTRVPVTRIVGGLAGGMTDEWELRSQLQSAAEVVFARLWDKEGDEVWNEYLCSREHIDD